MAGDRDFRPDLSDGALLVDQESGALDAHVFFAIHAFFGPDAVAFAHVGLFVGGEGEAEFELIAEPAMALDVVLRNTDDDRILVGEILDQITEILGFERAARRVVARVEIKHDVLFTQKIL